MTGVRSGSDEEYDRKDDIMIGLKRGTVKLYDHEKEWELEAQNTIMRLKKILGSTARDIQHVGSTAIFP